MLYTIDGGFTAEEIVHITGGSLKGILTAPITQLSTDSRDKNNGGLFVAIKGERFDGHEFIGEAVKNGAVCYLTSRPDSGYYDAAAVLTDDTVAALGALANAHRRRIDPVTVAVTGSVGKTTTKQFIYSVLNEVYNTHKTEGNLNNEIGLPLTLLQLTKKNGASVLEFGMSARGEISRLSRIAEPDIAVITNIGSSHIEYLGSREGIRDAKMEIVEGLRPGGRLFLNGDEPLLDGVKDAIYITFDDRNINTADITIGSAVSDIDGSIFDISAFGKKIRDIEIPVIGCHNIYNAAVAFGVGLTLNMCEDDIRRGLLKFKNTGMRQNIYKSDGMTIIEDCYNASPESMASSLAVLAAVSRQNGSRSIAVLGDMRELGGWSETLHLGVGRLAAESRVTLLFTFGEDAKLIAEGAAKAGMNSGSIYIFEDISDPKPLICALQNLLAEGDTVLFKASRAIELERVVNALKAR
jgi:UDP-N-acetylmuramoyl-tripeptide--D-alanyl-D-alanine ligase